MDAPSPHLTGILLAYGVFTVGIFSPGPNILAIIGTAMSESRRAGKALALGIATGSFLWSMLAWLGLTTLIAAYADLMTTIRIAGALYLFWLGFKAFRSAARSGPIPAAGTGGATTLMGLFRRGLTIQMTNPKAALTWTATMSLAVTPDAPIWVGACVVVGATLLSFAGHLGYALAFSTKPMVAAYLRARRWIEAGLGLFFWSAGAKLLSDRA
ncbi:LysE family transporter [Marivibrio halodurans]|uniref:LysE family transporter n=1 Tax=Marivibrio halodurans TaxID=2039722 RepID=A0A8J7SH41_9PROT|nr:LysE family transporter [Marivibrio halodurans]MBP5856148.1 LysE family transporter [Marivibrio halodurans]